MSNPDAKDFARIAAQIGQLADHMNPADSDPYAAGRKLAVFHLRSAAKLARDIAEAKAAKEEPV